jgi:integrase
LRASAVTRQPRKDYRLINTMIAGLEKSGDHVFPRIRQQQPLLQVKELCEELKFRNAGGFKLHSFRHHVASLCANHQVAHRKALSWLGHSDSSILQLYYHLTDSDSQAAMDALAGDGFRPPLPCLRAIRGQIASRQSSAR